MEMGKDGFTIGSDKLQQLEVGIKRTIIQMSGYLLCHYENSTERDTLMVMHNVKGKGVGNVSANLLKNKGKFEVKPNSRKTCVYSLLG